MIDAGIFDNDILVVDRAIKPRHNHVVVAIVDGDLTVKYLDDKGGNKYQLQAFMRGPNLHALWYSGIIKSMVEESDAMTARLLKRKSAFEVQKWSAVRTAEQSCQIVGGQVLPAKASGAGLN